MRKLFVYFVAALLVLPVLVSAGEGDGGYAGSFLSVPIGARPVGMGGAYIAVANDGAGAFYNPAGVANIKQSILATSYRTMDFDRKLGYVSFITPTQGNSALGFNWLYAGSGSVEARNTDGDPLGYDISENNHAVSAVFAKRFEKLFAVGFRGTYLHTEFADMSAYSVKFDLGVMLYLSQLFDREVRDLMFVQDLQAGLVVRNLGAVYRWNNEDYFAAHSYDIFGSDHEDKVPLEVGLGGSGRFLQRKLLLASDALIVQHQGLKLHAGAEYFVKPEFSIRTGYADESFTAGAGFIFKLGEKNLALDYAFSTDRVGEGSEHIFSFDLLF